MIESTLSKIQGLILDENSAADKKWQDASREDYPDESGIFRDTTNARICWNLFRRK